MGDKRARDQLKLVAGEVPKRGEHRQLGDASGATAAEGEGLVEELGARLQLECPAWKLGGMSCCNDKSHGEGGCERSGKATRHSGLLWLPTKRVPAGRLPARL